jgi:hypothetical protein
MAKPTRWSRTTFVAFRSRAQSFNLRVLLPRDMLKELES